MGCVDEDGNTRREEVSHSARVIEKCQSERSRASESRLERHTKVRESARMTDGRVRVAERRVCVHPSPVHTSAHTVSVNTRHTCQYIALRLAISFLLCVDLLARSM